MAERALLPINVRRGLSVIAILSAYAGWTPACADAVGEYAAKSVLTLNLARFTDWPPEVFKDSSATVNVCVLGDEAVQQAFTVIDKKRVGNRTLSLHNINGDKRVELCHVLYISAETAITARLFEQSRKQPILTIGDGDSFLAQGGMVYLEMVDAKIKLHINLSAAQKAEVHISSRVLKLATIFNP
ncbi:MAG: YfiR family protein [Methylovulum sp.]|nr:YfiR family protein [Methylovulum sp.]